VQVLDRCRFEQKSCVGATSHSDTSKSLQLRATLRERHLDVARLKDVLCSKNALGATSQSKHMKSLQLGATLREGHLEVARIFVVMEPKKLARSDVLERHLEVAPAPERGFESDTPESLAFSSNHDAREGLGSDLSQRHPHVAPEPVQVSFLTLNPGLLQVNRP